MKLVDFDERLAAAKRMVDAIISADAFGFGNLTPSRLPASPGIYVISTHEGHTLRAGKAARQTLRSRLYQNHLTGSQKGNLPAQLIRDRVCPDFPSARVWIRENCRVQWLEQKSLEAIGLDISTSEYFLLALLQPKYCD